MFLQSEIYQPSVQLTGFLLVCYIIILIPVRIATIRPNDCLFSDIISTSWSCGSQVVWTLPTNYFLKQLVFEMFKQPLFLVDSNRIWISACRDSRHEMFKLTGCQSTIMKLWHNIKVIILKAWTIMLNTKKLPVLVLWILGITGLLVTC